MRLSIAIRRWLGAIPCLLGLAGCGESTQHIPPVTGFELDQYLGRWHEIARLPHRFERNLVAVTAEYSLREDGTVRVVNRGYSTTKREWKEAVGRARFRGDSTDGLLEVSFFGPFYGDYKIIRLDADYGHAVVTSSTYDYLWILARTPELRSDTLAALVSFIRESGFDVSRLEYPPAEPDNAAAP